MGRARRSAAGHDARPVDRSLLGSDPRGSGLPLIVVDASVAIKWIFEEEFSAEARALLDEPDVPIAPALLLMEAGSALWRRRRRGELTSDEVQRLFDVFLDVPIGFVDEAALVGPALDLALALDHPIYDCLYLALALREDVLLATADMPFADTAIRNGYAPRLRLFGTPQP